MDVSWNHITPRSFAVRNPPSIPGFESMVNSSGIFQEVLLQKRSEVIRNIRNEYRKINEKWTPKTVGGCTYTCKGLSPRKCYWIHLGCLAELTEKYGTKRDEFWTISGSSRTIHKNLRIFCDEASLAGCLCDDGNMVVVKSQVRGLEKTLRGCSWPGILRYRVDESEYQWCGLKLSDFACRREIMG